MRPDYFYQSLLVFNKMPNETENTIEFDVEYLFKNRQKIAHDEERVHRITMALPSTMQIGELCIALRL